MSFRVLVVDDHDDVYRVVSRALSKEGCEVQRAATVDDALQVLSSWNPDFILSDYSMPEKSGGDLLRAVVNVRPDLIEHQRFVFLTGHPDLARPYAEPYGLTVLEKPYRLDLLRRILLSRLGAGCSPESCDDMG